MLVLLTTNHSSSVQTDTQHGLLSIKTVKICAFTFEENSPAKAKLIQIMRSRFA